MQNVYRKDKDARILRWRRRADREQGIGMTCEKISKNAMVNVWIPRRRDRERGEALVYTYDWLNPKDSRRLRQYRRKIAV